MFGKLKSQLKSKIITWLGDNGGPMASPGIGGRWNMGDIMGCYRNGSYDNNFPNITRIAESFAEVAPFAIDASGEKLNPQPHLIDVLNNPNEEMSGPDFWETLVVMMLVHPVVYLLCWRKEGRSIVAGGRITPENIAGFTFLEGVGVSTINGQTTYYCNGDTYTDKEVIALSLNVNPYNLLAGYSPSIAAKKWATVDDYVANYQAGYFRNGAVPSGQFVITARTTEEFNKIVDALQANHRGANNANNPLYVHRPVSTIDDKPLGAQVEWIPYAQTTEKGTLQSIFDQVNKKIDMDFGVPQEVKGYLQNSNYASAEIADYVFARRVIYPKLCKIYSKFTHALNRVTGGLGFALSFDYELPMLTDVRTAQAEALRTILSEGFTLESAVDALQLPSSFKKLVKDESAAPTATTSEEDSVEDEAGSVPSNTEKSLKQKAVDVIDPVAIKRGTDERIYGALKKLNEEVIDIALGLARDNRLNDARQSVPSSVKTAGLVEHTTRIIVSVLITIMLEEGQEAANSYAAELGLGDLEMELTEEEIDKLTERITELLQKFVDQTIEEIASRASSETTTETTDEELRKIAELKLDDEYRYERWAISERYEAEQTAVLIAALIAGDEADLVPYKTWEVDPNSNDLCVDCLRMDRETVPADQPFSNGDFIPHYHPYCRCRARFSWRRPEKSIKVACPSCGRYMLESTGGHMKNVICANSKCKKHYDIEVHKGKASFAERKVG